MAENATATDTKAEKKVSYRVVRLTKAEMAELRKNGQASFAGGGVQNQAANYNPGQYSGQYNGDGRRESDNRFYALLKGPNGDVRASYEESQFDRFLAMENGETVDFTIRGEVIDGKYVRWAEIVPVFAAKPTTTP